ncbi:MAG: lipid A biosynthesis acyltransferase [Lysobacterales bacterium 69-70]|nr:lipid A biosynthesis acyltransferase [Xanthomonadaceae bacterium]ODU30902.1 MAG: lipid A biosynthesis acyltransferase [Xanthomonadaceae bacterium SCN 69-320]ODV22227.1 MAG: lipid A biosynthesis acyltransferase [Xanthomonadaceae bacterium SCN 69-25]OJY98488.1 MAG: lipid A biosynthesis acyltransferase [Xanthomonadales bacterium 69-70]
MRLPLAILYFLLRLVGRLPLRVLHALGALLGGLFWWSGSQLRHHTEVNFRLIHTQFGEKERQRTAKRTLRETGKSFTEIARIWGGGAERALALVREVDGEDLFNAALASGRGLIIAAPHLGCWELLNFWLCSRTALAIVYRPPRNPALEPLLLRARGALNPEQIRAEGAGVRALYKRLQAGGVVGILPDQQPKQGEGEFAPFFGVPALTMVLVSRLAQRTGATVLFAFAERLPRGRGFRVRFRAAPPDIASEDLPRAVAALNRGVEDCVNLAFDQYQWHYKRFQYRPDPNEPNPYWRPR